MSPTTHEPKSPRDWAALFCLFLGGWWLFAVFVLAYHYACQTPAIEDATPFIFLAGGLVPVGLLVLARVNTPSRTAFAGRLFAILSLGAFLLWPAAHAVGQAYNRMYISKWCRQSSIAMHNYHNDHHSLPPPASTDPAGRPLLSWRVLILPYLEQDRLHQEFHLDEPWDSPHNLKLLPRMPKLYEHPVPRYRQPGMTHFQVFVGGGALFDWGKTRTFTELTAGDGTSNTILIIDALEAVPWTKPADLEYDPGKPLPRLHVIKGTVTTGFGDCSTRSLRAPTTPERERLYRQLITWNGKENEDISDIFD